MGSFSNALSALTANSRAIDVTSTNLANLNTLGYKKDQVSFEDLVHQTLGAQTNNQAASGSSAIRTFRQFSQGSLQTTNGAYDAAIQGSGFFVVQNAAGQQVFTRDGSFKVDSVGHLVTADGNFVQGWNANAQGVLTPAGATSNLVLPSSPVRAAQASTFFTINANLNSNAVVGGPDGTFTSPVVVIDSQGTTHQVAVSFTKTAANAWTYNVTIPAADVGQVGPPVQLTTGSFTFDASGNLLTGTLPAGGQIPIAITGLADSANNINLNWNVEDATARPLITQFGQPSSTSTTSKDGWQSAQLVSVGIGDQGKLQANYSDGSTVAVGQLAIASVVNPDSLVSLSGNQYAVSAKTSTPIISVAGVGTQGSVVGGAVETSTVDIAEEFTHLLTYERGYQANSKVITTQDEILQDVLALKR